MKIIKCSIYPIAFALGALFIFNGCQNRVNENSELWIDSSNQELIETFNWAKQKARSYVMTGKSGCVNISEKGDGTGNSVYIPSYWAGYPFRSAFYIRDYCHQMAGAHLLGLEQENLAMIKAFAATSTQQRKWYPLWALNFDGSIYSLDYYNDSCFVREVPAVFELVEKGYKQYLWTGNNELIQDTVLWNFYEKAITEFVQLHDQIIPNGVTEGDGSGGIFNGVATYNESYVPLVEAGDGIAAQYQAFNAYAEMLKRKGKSVEAENAEKQAELLKSYFNTQWSTDTDAENYIRGYDVSGNKLIDFGRENSIFMPLKFITFSDAKNKDYLHFCHDQYKLQNPKTLNIEGVSYLPDVFFAYNMVEEGWYWTKYIMKQRSQPHIVSLGGINGDYPEISYSFISNVVENMLGVEPNAAENALATISRLSEDVKYLEVSNIPIGKHRVSVKHVGSKQTVIRHQSGDADLLCTVRFYTECQQIRINGTVFMSKQGELNGEKINYVTITVPQGGEIIVDCLN